MILPLLIFYVVSFLGLLASGFLHGQKKPKEMCEWNLLTDIVKTLVELLFIWWLLGWRVW